MAPMTILCVACIMMYTRASKCKGDQHCSDCDSTTGYCISECEPGYFDQKCSTICNKNCRNKKCTLSINGNDNCTEGCVLGYQGPGCSRPCYNPGGVCTECPGGCDGGYCQLGSSCVSGCVDSYHGSGCKTCHRGCKTCNRITGTCTECHPSFPGPNCEQETNTTRGCEGGCVPGHIDRDCKHCSDKCLNKTCHPKNEPFDKRCSPGFYGEHCNKTCGVCIDGDCDQMTGMCFRGCNRTKNGCEPSCRANCTLAECDICRQVKFVVVDITVNGRASVTVGDNDTVTFQCVVQGYPPPDVSLVHAGNYPPPIAMRRKRSAVYERVMRISNCSEYGEYFCRDTNTIGLSGHKQQMVVVQAVPRRQETSTLEINDEQNRKHSFGKMLFTLCAYPEPSVTLSKFEGHDNSRSIKRNEKYKLTAKYLTQNRFEYTFIINNITNGDFGAYVFGVAYAEGVAAVVIVASPSQEVISNHSRSILIGCSIMAAALIAIAVIIRSRLEQIRGYWNVRFQHYITPAHDTSVSLQGVTHHANDEDAHLYDSVSDGQHRSGYQESGSLRLSSCSNVDTCRKPVPMAKADVRGRSLMGEDDRRMSCSSSWVDGIMHMVEKDMSVANPELTNHGSDISLGSREEMSVFVTISADDTNKGTITNLNSCTAESVNTVAADETVPKTLFVTKYEMPSQQSQSHEYSVLKPNVNVPPL